MLTGLYAFSERILVESDETIDMFLYSSVNSCLSLVLLSVLKKELESRCMLTGSVYKID